MSDTEMDSTRIMRKNKDTKEEASMPILGWIATVLGGITVVLLAWMATTFSDMSAEISAMSVEIATIKEQVSEIRTDAKEGRSTYWSRSEQDSFATLIRQRIEEVCRRLSMVEGH